MLTPLSQRPFHSVRLYAANTIDSITSLFYEILSLLNKKWDAYAKYYDYRIFSREQASEHYSANLIQFSSNQLYPGKRVDVPTLKVSDDNYALLQSASIEKYIEGLCLGMCIDHMNRIRSSQKSFWETITAVGLKFTNGSSKRGFIYHHSQSQIATSFKYFQIKIEKIFSRFKETLDKELKETLLDHEIKEIFKDQINLEYTSKYERAKRISFIANNYKCKFYKYGIENHDDLPEGDYFLRELPSEKSGHIVCVYKRKEGTVVFDSNYGTLFFRNHEGFTSYVESSTTRMFGAGVAKLSLYHCKDKEVA